MGIGEARDTAHHRRIRVLHLTVANELDICSLENLLMDHGALGERGLSATQITGGRPNLTNRLSGHGQVWVLRRPPGAGITPSARNVGREFRIMDALQNAAVPVPRTVLNCEDPSIIGASFTLVSFVVGEVLRTQADLQPLSDEEITAIHDELIRVLALLHSLPYETLGLGDFGRPEGLHARFDDGASQQWNLVATRELVDVDRLYKALVESPPPSQARASNVHGDFRVDDTILGVASGRMAALVDWEMTALGDPLTDQATLCAYQHPSFDHVVGDSAAATSTRWLGVDATAQHYATLTGTDLQWFDRYRALLVFKLAVIAEGIAARHGIGLGTGSAFETDQRAVHGLLASGLSIMAAQR